MYLSYSQINFSISLDTPLGRYARLGRFFSIAECKLDVPLPLLVSGSAKFELRVGTIDALLGGSSASEEEDQVWIIPGGTVPEGNVPKVESEGKSKSKIKKEEPKGKGGKGKKKKGGKAKPVETKEPAAEPEPPKKPQPPKPAVVVWPSPAFSMFLAEETLDTLLNLSLTQPSLPLSVQILRVSSEADGSTVPQSLEGTLDIAAMCQVGCDWVLQMQG